MTAYNPNNEFAVQKLAPYDPFPLDPSPPDTWRTPIHAHVIVWLTLPLMFAALVFVSYEHGVSLGLHRAFDMGVGTGFAAKAGAL